MRKISVNAYAWYQWTGSSTHHVREQVSPQKNMQLGKKKRSVLRKQMAPEVIMKTENTSSFVHFVTKVVYLILCCI